MDSFIYGTRVTKEKALELDYATTVHQTPASFQIISVEDIDGMIIWGHSIDADDIKNKQHWKAVSPYSAPHIDYAITDWLVTHSIAPTLYSPVLDK